MMAINFFNSVDYLEPRCRHCGSKIDYGITTEWDDEKGCHLCSKCQNPVETDSKEIIIDHETYVD